MTYLRMTALALALTFAGTAKAHNEEVTSPPVAIGGGLICDTLEQAVEQVTTSPRPDFIEGCGVLQGRFPVTVTLLPDVIHKGHRFHMAKFTFTQPVPWGVQVQYGFWGRPTPETPKGDAI